MPKRVREPIQVYLTPRERAELDEVARELGVSRSEALRRGIPAIPAGSIYGGALRDLASEGLVTPATGGPGPPPPSAPVAPLRELLRELSQDRDGR